MTGSPEGRPRRPGRRRGDISTIASANGLLRREKQLNHDSAGSMRGLAPTMPERNHRGTALRTIIGLAITRLVEERTSWSIKRLVRTAQRYRIVQLRVGEHTITAEDPVPADLRDDLAQIN
jgi:hypothetical protein